MRPRDESAHPVIQQAMDQGYIGSEGAYPIDGFATHDAANRGRLAIKRGGEHLGVSAAPWVVDQYGEHCPGPCKDPNAPHGVRFRLWSKDSARQHVLTQSGGDPAKLRYNPFMKGKGPVVDDYGRPLT